MAEVWGTQLELKSLEVIYHPNSMPSPLLYPISNTSKPDTVMSINKYTSILFL